MSSFNFPTSRTQQGLWFLDHWHPGTATYTIPAAYRLRGPLDATAITAAINDVIARHEALRTTFAVQDGVPVQVVAETLTIEVPVVDLAAQAGGPELQRLVDDHIQQPFDLARGPLVRALLVRLAPDDHVIALGIHHIVFDGWSMDVFTRELAAAYAARCRGVAPELPEPSLQYGDYVVWQQEMLQDESVRAQVAYWRERLADPTPLDVPTDHVRPPHVSSRGATTPLRVPRQVAEGLEAIARQRHATLFMALVAAWSVLLFRYTRQEDIIVGTPIAGRDHPDTHDMVGCFVNTLALRMDLGGHPSFSGVLERVRDTALGAYDHQDVPFDVLVDELHVERDPSRTPLFDTFFAMQGADDVQLDGLVVERKSAAIGTAKFDLSVYVGPGADGLEGVVEFRADLFERSTIERLARHYETLLAAIVNEPTCPISTLAFLTDAERAQLLTGWNATAADYPRDQTVPQLFFAQAARTPEAPALTFGDATLSYAELADRVRTWTARLRAAGVQAGALVGVHLERSIDLVVAVLAILEAGGAYVPLDPAFPAERLAFMLEDARAAVLVTERSLAGRLSSGAATVVVMDAPTSAVRLEIDARPGRAAGPDDLAYVLYTSGSTGQPKGVEIPHRALTNFLCAMQREPGCTARDVVLAVTTLSFDIAGLELYLPLITGGHVVLASRETAMDGRALAAEMTRVRPTILQATPATWRMLIEAGWRGTPALKALCGGEALPPDLADALLTRVDELWNMYGPTETTIWSSVERITSSADITIGHPIANTTFYVVDAAMQPVPIGVPGELLIGGDGLARGYRGRAALTAEKFLRDPFAGDAPAGVYRTGDLAKWRADGKVVHLGRLDHQVKLRGFRIELGEIEAALTSHPTVQQAVAIVREDRPGQAMLVGYVLPASGAAVDVAALRAHVRTTLPDYMVPAQILALEAFPLTPNGKIDRKRLPAPAAMADVAARVAPRTETERRLAAIWSDVLGVSDIGIYDGFFELGGHSLLAVRLLGRIAEAFGTDVPLPVLFAAPSIAAFAGHIDRAIEQTDDAHAEAPGPVDRLTSTERRLMAVWEELHGRPARGVDELMVTARWDPTTLPHLIARLRQEFGSAGEGLPLVRGSASATIREIATAIDGVDRTASIVRMAAGGVAPPIFIVHAAGGYVFPFRALAVRLGQDRPVYAIQARPSADDDGRPETIEALAREYINQIRTVQPDGPYHLAGACFGGVVVFEMARQLRDEGERVPDAFLFDAFLPNNEQAIEDGYARIQFVDGEPPRVAPTPLRIHLRRMKKIGLWRVPAYLATHAFGAIAYQVMHAAERIRHRRTAAARAAQVAEMAAARATGEPGAWMGTEADPVHSRSMAIARDMIDRYYPAPYDGRLVRFSSLDGGSESTWVGLAANHEVHSIAAGHLDILEEPFVATIADIMRARMAAADAREEARKRRHASFAVAG
ncbi:MAG TPA: amino acid adenylation domain-containing protein [Vicinamibacterales bacterium]|jgi:amino acid adenylation domain-containing protein|nr:amino acid adenylation domain-containing protein [Vicinamibacterales bacterium]